MYPHLLKLRNMLPLLLMSLFFGGSTYPLAPINEFSEAEIAGGVEFEIETTDSRMRALVRQMSFDKDSKQIDIKTAKTILNVEFLDEKLDMIFTVPVGTSSLNIGVNSYPKGVYFLKLLLEDESDFISTRVIKDF